MKKAFKYAIISAVSYMILGCIVFELFPHLLLKIFNAEGSMLEFGITTLRILALSFPIAGISLVISSWFQALGNGVFSMIISIARQLIFLLPIALLLALSGDIQSIWWAFPIAEIAGLICSVLLYCLVNKKIVSKIE